MFSKKSAALSINEIFAQLNGINAVPIRLHDSSMTLNSMSALLNKMSGVKNENQFEKLQTGFWFNGASDSLIDFTNADE